MTVESDTYKLRRFWRYMLIFAAMQLPDFIDIHKHEHETPRCNDVLTLYSRHDRFQALTPGCLYSVGIHPWYIGDGNAQLDELRASVVQAGIMAIGECGLDTLRGAPPAVQAAIFREQVRLANACNKPLIIHCVRAFPQALALLKEATVPVVFHGFRKKQSVADAILQQGYYLSFGADLLKAGTTAGSVFAAIPPDRFFLETDDSNLNIGEIYEGAGRIRKTGTDTIILQVQENFKKVFSL